MGGEVQVGGGMEARSAGLLINLPHNVIHLQSNDVHQVTGRHKINPRHLQPTSHDSHMTATPTHLWRVLKLLNKEGVCQVSPKLCLSPEGNESSIMTPRPQAAQQEQGCLQQSRRSLHARRGHRCKVQRCNMSHTLSLSLMNFMTTWRQLSVPSTYGTCIT